MSSIVAIGGGEIKTGATAEIDRFIVELSGKENPSLLFLPTASHDAGGYINVVSRTYRRLGCKFSTLLLYRDVGADQTAAQKIADADIIYVGGGDTLKMLNEWDKRGVSAMLKSAYSGGNKIMCGLSAGAICWFSYGYSDSCPTPDEIKFSEVPALGLIDAVCCPHYDEPGREGFDGYIAACRRTGIAIENQSALVVRGNEATAIGKRAWRIDTSGKQPIAGGWQSLDSLL